jgi:hypothetical protein
MKIPKIDNVSAGYVFAYDAKTGAVLWTHEKIVEILCGKQGRPPRITEEECEQIRAEAARVYCGQEVKALIAPDGFAMRENARIAVDVDKKTLYEISDEPRNFTDFLAGANKKGGKKAPGCDRTDKR